MLDYLISAGVFTELGWATLLGKRIIILVPQDSDVESNFPLIKGIPRITETKIIYYNSADVNDLKNKLKETIKEEYKR